MGEKETGAIPEVGKAKEGATLARGIGSPMGGSSSDRGIGSPMGGTRDRGEAPATAVFVEDDPVPE